MESAFNSLKHPARATFNEDISNWNVENVVNMERMFFNCANFNQDISKWNLDNVKKTKYMITHAESFDLNINTNVKLKIKELYHTDYLKNNIVKKILKRRLSTPMMFTLSK
jgi:surface protein